MRITDVNIPESEIINGLEPVRMNKLGQIVVLAGKNGAGKTRLLNTIRDVITAKPRERDILESKRLIEFNESQIEYSKEQILQLQQSLNFNLPIKNQILSQINGYEQNIKERELEVIKQNDVLKWDLIVTDFLSNKYRVVDFVPKELVIRSISRRCWCFSFTKK